MNTELLSIGIAGNWNAIISVSPWIIGVGVLVLLLVVAIKMGIGKRWKRWEAVKLNIDLGGVGEVELRPNLEDIQVAHRIWVELVTRSLSN